MSRRFHHLVARRLAAPRLGRNLVPLFAGICLLLGLGLASTGSAHAQTAAGWNKRGLDAEYRQNYDASYEDYLKAHNKAPKNLTYIAHLERMRGLAAAQHVDRGRTLRQNGDYAGALTEFMRALQIDPGDQVAEQEIGITQRDQPPPSVSPLGQAIDQEQMSQQAALLKSLSSLAGPVVLQPVSNDPITLHMVEDTKVIYQAIAKLAGLNVLFDPDYTAKRIPVDLTNVSLSDALRIVGTISGTFYKPVTSNTILVAQNTRTKRTDLDDLAVQTFYLSNSAQANDGNEIQTAIRNLLDPSTKIYYVPSQNALVLRATADQLLLAQKIINDLDRAKPEVVVDVAVLEVNRDKVRNLGITLPQSITITPQASPTSTSSSTTSSTTTSTTSSSFTLDNLAHLNSTNFGVGITGGTLNALLTDTDTKVLQNPRIRASDGQRATLKIGSKIPIATGSYSSTLSTTASLGVQTQFTYLDVGVNIDMTPTVHFDREVSLKIKIEVSTESGTETISGVTEPIISQRTIDQVIQLKEGEPSILAGILTRQDNKNISGTPYLGEIPFFKFFFASTNKEVQRDEIVFVLIPHIVRESVLTAVNTGAIDTGTGQSIELRHDPSPTRGILPGNDVGGAVNPAPRSVPPARSAADAANAILQGPAPAANAAYAAVGARPGTGPGGTPPIAFAVQPGNSNYAVGSTFQAAVTLTNGRDVFSVPLQVQFDPHVLQLVNVDAGNLLAKGNQAVSAIHRDEGNGLVTIALSRPPNSGGVTGDGGVCTLTFKAVAAGDSNISLVKAGAKDSAQNTLPSIASSAVVHVK